MATVELEAELAELFDQPRAHWDLGYALALIEESAVLQESPA